MSVALARYRDIIDAPESFEIDFEGVESGATKPTNAAIRVNDLLERTTNIYQPLTSFSQKVQFLLDIQITIFDLFHARLSDSLSKYRSSTTAFGRTIQGEVKESPAELSGLGGIERLCRIYGSAEYLEKKMRDWNDDIFFLELWDELQDRARRATSGFSQLAGPISVSAVAERTSNTVGSDSDTGALFDETAASYKSLRIKTEDFMTITLVDTFRHTLRPYGSINPWSTLSHESVSSSSVTLPAELDATIQQLNLYLHFLNRALAQVSLRRITRQICLAIQTYLWDKVLMTYMFSPPGVTQFTRDVEAIWGTIDRYLGSGQGEMGMRRLKEGLVLLGLPEKPDSEVQTTAEVTLWDVEKRVFKNNESAREVLDELDLEVLSEGDARQVLGRILALQG